jgi:hypothetical protein
MPKRSTSAGHAFCTDLSILPTEIALTSYTTQDWIVPIMARHNIDTLFTEAAGKTVSLINPPVAGLIDAKLKGKPLIRYALTYEMPPGEVTLVDGKGSLEFDVVAYGEDGAKLNVVREMGSFTLKPNEVEHFVESPIVMPVQIGLPAGKVSLHTGVLDIFSQKVGTLEISGTVASKQQASK